MRIAIDLRCLEEEKISGVGEYALEIVRNLLEIDTKNEYVIFSNSFKKKNNNFDFLKEYPNVRLKRFRFPNKILNFSLWYLKWPKLDKLAGRADIFFAPNINFLAVSKACKTLTTFHDLSFERFPEFFSLKTRLWHYYFVNPRRIAKKSSQVVAVSRSTGKDLEEIYKISPKKIGVVLHGVSERCKIISRNDPKMLAIQKKYNLPYKFILYLGNIEPRKNIRSIIEAFQKIQKESSVLKNYKLVLAGNTSSLCSHIIKEEPENVLFAGYIDHEDKPYVYNLASLFVYPSFFEGFGLPVLEAMACGTPVIASNNSSIPEAAGNAAVLVDPNRPQELFEAMKTILQNEQLRDNLRKEGLKHIRKFSWKKSAQEILKILEDLNNS